MDPDPHGWYHVDHSTPTPGWFGHTPPQPQEPPSQPTVTHEQLAQLFNQVNVLSAQNANLQAQLSALQTQTQAAAQQAPPVTTAPAASVTPVTVARPSGHKVAVPDIFDGTRAKAKDFLRQLFVYFSATPSAFLSDVNKIYFALSYMRGHTAGPWANRHIDLLAEGKKPFANYSAFHQAVLAYFRDPHEAANAGSTTCCCRPPSTPRFCLTLMEQHSPIGACLYAASRGPASQKIPRILFAVPEIWLPSGKRRVDGQVLGTSHNDESLRLPSVLAAGFSGGGGVIQ